MTKWAKPAGSKKAPSAPVEVPTDLNNDEEIRNFSKKRLIELARHGGDTAARLAASELLERVEPKAEKKEAQLSKSEALKICDTYDRLFGTTTCPKCKHQFVKADA